MLEPRILLTVRSKKSRSGGRANFLRAVKIGTNLLFCIIPLALGVPSALPALQRKPETVSAIKQKRSPMPIRTTPLKSYSQTIPGSVVKIEMVAITPTSLTSEGKKGSVKPYWIANTETTWEAFDTFLMSGTPSVAYDQTDYPADAIAHPSKSYILPDLGWGHHGFPVINVSSLSVTMFCRWLSAQTGKKYRLPTEMEWEYACRAGTSSKPLSSSQLDKVAWYAANSAGKTHPVAKKQPNALKLYDMQGNVGEWVTDQKGKPVLCGGIFTDKADRLLPTMRRRFSPEWQATDPQLPKSRWWLADGNFVGFRIVCEP